MTRVILLLVCSIFAAPLRAEGVFDRPASAETFAHDLREATEALKGAKTLRGRYVQDKTLAGVPHPLHAEGTFLFVRDVGIEWRTVVPFESELVVTGEDIIQRENGKVSMHLPASKQPAVHVVGEIFASIFALDFERLSAHFELYSRWAGHGWELGLKPRGAQAGALRQIVVTGAKQVERVRVTDANGDATDIRLRATSVSKDAPTAAELAAFKP